MTEDKLKRVTVAGTVTAVLLAFILLIVLVYQMITISTLKSQEKKLLEEKAKLEILKNQTEQEIEYRSTAWYIEKYAREKLGLSYDNETKYKFD